MSGDSFISPSAVISGSAFIGANVRIFGATHVGPNCYIDDNVVIGYPSKEALTRIIKNRNIPTDLHELDKYAEGVTTLEGSCCIRFGSVISIGSRIAED